MRRAAFLAALALSGCAGSDCGGDWHEIGARDGRLGAEPQLAVYAARCGTQPDAARYNEGYSAGLAQRPRIPSF